MRKLIYDYHLSGILGFITVLQEGGSNTTFINLLRGDLHIGRKYYPVAREDLFPLASLPSPEENVFFIVDKSTSEKYPNRDDLLVPNIIAEHALGTFAFFTADGWL